MKLVKFIEHLCNWKGNRAGTEVFIVDVDSEPIFARSHTHAYKYIRGVLEAQRNKTQNFCTSSTYSFSDMPELYTALFAQGPETETFEYEVHCD